MAKIDTNKILKPGVVVYTAKEFVKTYGNITRSALQYAVANDLVDFVNFGGRENFIVMTDKTKQYCPNASPKRMQEAA